MPLLTGWPTDAGDGSVSTEARWRAMARLWAPSGVVDGYLARLDPDYAVGTVTVGAGAAWIDGHYCEQLTSSSVAVTSNGLVVIRWTPAANTFELLYRDGATTPTQTDPTWELPLAQMSGGAMTDLREFVTRGPVTTSTIDHEAVTYAKLAGGAIAPFFDDGGAVQNTATTLTAGFQGVVLRHVHQAGVMEHLQHIGVGRRRDPRGGRRHNLSDPGCRRLQPRHRTRYRHRLRRHPRSGDPRQVPRPHRRLPHLLRPGEARHRVHRHRRVGDRFVPRHQGLVMWTWGPSPHGSPASGRSSSAGAGVAMIWREVKSRQHKEIKRLDEELSATQEQVVVLHRQTYELQPHPGRPRHRCR